MSRPIQYKQSKHKASLLEGAPPWITEELLADTRQTWQPFYDQPLTTADALEILLTVGRLMDLVGEADG